MFGKTKYLSALISAIAFSFSNAALSQSEICEVAAKSNEAEYLAKFKQLIEQNKDINKIDCNGKNLFEVAYSTFEAPRYVADIRKGRFDNLILLVKSGYDVDKTGRDGNTPLHLAARNNDINLIYFLVEQGANINARNDRDKERRYDTGETPLFAAHRQNSLNTDAFNLLLHLGADDTVRRTYGGTVFRDAVYLKSVNFIELLLQHGFQPSPELVAFAKQRVEKDDTIEQPEKQIITLIEKYQNLRIQAILQEKNPREISFNPPPTPEKQLLPAKQDSALIKAVCDNNIEAIESILTQNIDLDAIAKSGETPLHIALSKRYNSIAKLLIEAGANVNLQNANGAYPLFLVTRDLELTKLLLKNGAITNQRTNSFPYAVLLDVHDADIVKLLIDYGADVNYRCRRCGANQTPLIRAVKNGYYEIAKLLLENGADPNFSPNSYLPLFLAIEQRNYGRTEPKFVKLLLDYGANTDIRLSRFNGYTPLSYAVQRNNYGAFLLLLEKADREELNKAFDRAFLLDRFDMIRALRRAGAEHFDKQQLLNDAVEKGYIQLVHQLLRNGLNSYLKTYQGSLNLIHRHSSDRFDLDMTKLLIENGADVNVAKINERGETWTTPLISSLDDPEAYEIVKLLLDAGADVNLMTDTGKTALSEAISRSGWWYSRKSYSREMLQDRLKTIELLLDAGAEIDDNDITKESPQEIVNRFKQVNQSATDENRKMFYDYADRIDLLFQQYK